MRFGVIGFGKIAKKFIQSIEYTSDGNIYAIASHSIDKNDLYLKEHPDIKVYHDYEALLNDQNVEAVYIALPHKYHKEWILKAIDHHIPVLSEKPMVLTVSDIDEIKELANSNKVYCLEALKTKFNQGFGHLKTDLELIGKVKKIETSFGFDATAFQDTSYLFDLVQGGALNDVGSYLLGFILELNKTKIVNIESKIELVAGIERYFEAQITFKDNCLAIARGAIDRNQERLAIIEGELGKIEIPMFNRIVDYRIIINDGTIIERNYPIIGDDMTLEIQSFINDVRSHKLESNIHSLDDTKKILELTNKIREAAK